MTSEVHSRECRPRFVAGHQIQRRQRHRHHIGLARLFHFETPGVALRPAMRTASSAPPT